MSRDRRAYDLAKRGTDICVSAAGLVVTVPLQLAVAGLVLAAHGRPVLFRQDRPGKDGRTFQLIKFRSMRHADPDHVTDAERLTPLGRFIRSTSLDELPTLWNVLKGDMSLVGPRPLLVHYLELYTAKQARRHSVRPGVTGLAQVQGRNNIDWEAKLALDVEYVDNRSFRLDVGILWQTLTVVLRRDGVATDGHATATEFHGSATAPTEQAVS